MNNSELSLIRDRLNSAISQGKGIDNKLHLMDDVESLITTIQEQQLIIEKLVSKLDDPLRDPMDDILDDVFGGD